MNFFFFLNVRFTSIRHALALCALRLGSRRPLRLSVLSAFNNTDFEAMFVDKFGWWIMEAASVM